jgi:predicted Zn-dependent protease
VNRYRSYRYSLGGFGQIPGTSNAFSPFCATTNPTIEKGDVDRDELIGDVKNGVLASWIYYPAVMGKSGDYMAVCRGGNYKIENGELKYPLNKFRLSDNILKRIWINLGFTPPRLSLKIRIDRDTPWTPSHRTSSAKPTRRSADSATDSPR